MSGIRNISNMAKKWDDSINLSIGQPEFNIPKEIKEEAIKAICLNKNKYSKSAGLDELREQVLELYKLYGFEGINIDNILVTPGSTAALTLSLMTLLDPGDEVIVQDPYYNEYKYIPIIIGAKIKYVDTYPDFEYTADKIEKMISNKTKIIVINNPANPTGKVLKKDNLKEIFELARKRNIYVILDEVYEKYIYEDDIEHYGRFYEKAITISGLSKTFSMTGWRIGYMVSLDKDIILNALKLQQYLYVCAPTPFQVAASYALKNGCGCNIRDIYRRKRDIAYNILKRKFKIVKPEGAFYIFPEIDSISATDFCKKVAGETHVLIIPGKVFSNKNSNFRLSFAYDDEKLEIGCKKICQCV